MSNPDLCGRRRGARAAAGSFPALNARGSDDAPDKWITNVKSRLDPEKDAPFAVNQIVHRSNARLMHDMEVIVKHEVPIVITSLGARPEINEAVHSYGGLVFHDVINNKLARKLALRSAVPGAALPPRPGGHAGTLSPFDARPRGARVVGRPHRIVGRPSARPRRRRGSSRPAPTSPAVGSPRHRDARGERVAAV